MDILRDIEKMLPFGLGHDSDLFDLDGFPTGQLSPLFDDVIPMDTEFSPIPFLNGFVRNILHRRIKLTVDEWRRLIQFCTTNDFKDDSSCVGLQLLFECSKADPSKLEEVHFSYKTMYDTFIIPYLPSFKAERTNNCETAKIKEFLLSPVILKTFKQCLDHVIGGSCDLSTISTVITSMHLFKGNVSLPIRGATAHDGIFMNFLRQCNINLEEIADADCFTLAGHMTAHYLARKLTNSFSFGTEAGAAKSMELGTMFEMFLFGLQPNWWVCHSNAAARFLTLVHDDSATIPLKIDHGLRPRMEPSPSFGIDFAIEQSIVMG